MMGRMSGGQAYGSPGDRRQCAGEGGWSGELPLYQLKAEFFKTLGHPARIRILELLSEREHAGAEMLRKSASSQRTSASSSRCSAGRTW
jgi:ArsR family transcriptional regulator